MLYLAIDQHAKQLTVNLRNEQGEVLLRRQVSTRWKLVREFFRRLKEQAAGEGGRGCRKPFSKSNTTTKTGPQPTGGLNYRTRMDGCIGSSSPRKKKPSPREASLRPPLVSTACGSPQRLSV